MTTVVEMTSAYIIVGDFDSRRRYLRKDLVGSASNFAVPHGRTVQIVRSNNGRQAKYRYSVNGHTIQDYVTGDGPTLTFNADFTLAVI